MCVRYIFIKYAYYTHKIRYINEQIRIVIYQSENDSHLCISFVIIILLRKIIVYNIYIYKYIVDAV